MIYLFQDFELDEQLFELRRAGAVVAMQARVFRALLHLIEHRERVVSKDELMDAVWKDVVVSDTALSQVIMLARKAVHDEGEQQAVLKTVRGRGFRFVAPVGIKQDAAPAPAREERRHSLVGREPELQMLRQRLKSAVEGHGSLVLVGGEPGIGKSCLAEAIAAEAQELGVDVLWGKAWEEGGAPPFWPFIQILRGLSERDGPDALRELAGAQLDELAPLWAESADPAAVRGSGPRLSEDGPRRRFRLFDAMARLLRNAAGGAHRHVRAPRARPRLIVFEDLHACDEDSLLMLRFLGQELSDCALLLLGTFRDLELTRDSRLRALLGGSPESAQYLQLRGLAEADSLALLECRLGAQPPPRLAAALHELSGGNPLLVGELARQFELGTLQRMVEQGALATIPLPERISNAVHIQLAVLPESTQAALASAAALGREFSLPLLAQLLETSERDLLERLAPALARGILRSPSGAAGQLVFAHALVRNSVYSELTPGRRAELHRRIGELLEREQVSPYELAHHAFLAAAVGGRRKAIDYAERASAHALEMRAYETAAELSDRAIDLLSLEPGTTEAIIERLFVAGEAWYLAGELKRAVARFDRATELARVHQDQERLARAVGISCFVQRGTIMHDRLRQAQIRDTLRDLPDGDSGLKATLLIASAVGDYAPDGLSARQAQCRAGVEMARRVGDVFSLEVALSGSHLVLWGPTPPAEMRDLASELLEMSREQGDEEMLLDALIWRIVDSTELGDLATMLRDREEYLARAEARNSAWHLYMGSMLETMYQRWRGNFARADALSRRTVEIGRRQQEPLAESFYAVRQLFKLLDGRCSGEEARGLDLEPPDDMPAGYRVFWALAWTRGERAEQARSWLLSLGSHGFADLPLDHLRRPILASLALVAVQLGELAAAEALYQRLLPDAHLHLVLQAGVYLGPVSFYLGVLCAALQRSAPAVEHFERALTECRRINADGYLLRTQLEYARLLEAGCRKPTAAGRPQLPVAAPSRLSELLGSARRLAQELDCDHWEQAALAPPST